MTFGGYGAFQQFADATRVVSNIPNYTAADYQYGAGFMLEKGVEMFLFKKAGDAFSFKLNGGFGVFGEKGLNIKGYKINALYQDGKTGGTYFSIKQGIKGGNLLRWDSGLIEGTRDQFGLHSHFRFKIGGSTYGSTAQYPWYAPFQFWKYKKP